MTGQYRKKPVVIEAVYLEAHNVRDVAAWCGGTPEPGYGRPSGLLIPTLEGTMRADLGDWVIKGVAGEFYPCKPDIFAATYEPAAIEGES